MRKCERAVWVLNGTSGTQTNKSSGSLAFSHNAQKAPTAVCQRRDRHQQTNDIKKNAGHAPVNRAPLEISNYFMVLHRSSSRSD